MVTTVAMVAISRYSSRKNKTILFCVIEKKKNGQQILWKTLEGHALEDVLCFHVFESQAH